LKLQGFPVGPRTVPHGRPLLLPISRIRPGSVSIQTIAHVALHSRMTTTLMWPHSAPTHQPRFDPQLIPVSPKPGSPPSALHSADVKRHKREQHKTAPHSDFRNSGHVDSDAVADSVDAVSAIPGPRVSLRRLAFAVSGFLEQTAVLETARGSATPPSTIARL